LTLAFLISSFFHMFSISSAFVAPVERHAMVMRRLYCCFWAVKMRWGWQRENRRVIGGILDVGASFGNRLR
jgi:hypothetical protein